MNKTSVNKIMRHFREFSYSAYKNDSQAGRHFQCNKCWGIVKISQEELNQSASPNDYVSAVLKDHECTNYGYPLKEMYV